MYLSAKPPYHLILLKTLICMIRACKSHGKVKAITSLYYLNQACQLTHSSLDQWLPLAGRLPHLGPGSQSTQPCSYTALCQQWISLLGQGCGMLCVIHIPSCNQESKEILQQSIETCPVIQAWAKDVSSDTKLTVV